MKACDSSSSLRPFIATWLLWFGAWGAVLLPVLSHCGYSPIELEYLGVAGLCGVIALLSAWLARFRWALICLMSVVVLANTQLYFGRWILETPTSFLIYSTILLGFVLFALRKPQAGLRIVGIAGAAQVLGALVSTPNARVSTEWPRPERSNPAVPPIVHVILDEHTGLATVPRTPECQALSQRITELYLSRGFLVFTHAYSEHANTASSLPYLLNPMTPPQANTEELDHRSLRVKESYLFRQAAKYRDIDATYLTEMDLSPALRASGARVRSLHYDTHAGAGKAAAYFQAAGKRLPLLEWTVLNWFYQGNHSPLIGPLVQALPLSAFLNQHMLEPPPTVFSGAYELKKFEERLQRNAVPSTYYFGHFLVPHHPFCLDENGTVLPKEQWGGILASSPFRPKTAEAREALYVLHLGQALYADKLLAQLADALDQKFTRQGSIILVHSDHGSRLTLPVGTPAESPWGWERFSRNCFLAIRIPGLPGALIDEPVSMDRLVNILAKNDFLGLDIKSLPAADSNPFAEP